MVLELMETDLLTAIAADLSHAESHPSEARQLGWYGRCADASVQAVIHLPVT